jgi:hypothetical protein
MMKSKKIVEMIPPGYQNGNNKDYVDVKIGGKKEWAR